MTRNSLGTVNSQKMKPIAGDDAILCMIDDEYEDLTTYVNAENGTVVDILTRLIGLGVDVGDTVFLMDEYSPHFKGFAPEEECDTYPVKLFPQFGDVEKVKGDLPYITEEAAASAFIDMLARDGFDAAIAKETWMTLLVFG